MNFPRYLSVKEVAKVLRVHEKTAYKMIYAGDLPGHFMIGSMHFIDEEELLKGLKAKATQAKKTASKIHQNRTEDRHGLMK